MLLQMGVPGGPELLIVLLVTLLLFGIPLVIVILLGLRWLQSEGDEEAVQEQLAELQAEVAELRTELQDEGADDGD